MKKLISVFLVLGMMNLTFSGCTSSRLISVEEVIQMKQSESFLILHDHSKKYILLNYKFTDSQLQGVLTKYSKVNGYNIHVYSPIDFNFSLPENSRNEFTFNKSEISKITYTKFNRDATALLISGVVLGIFGIIMISALNQDFMNFDDSYFENIRWGF